jgi:hypothetical protein
VDWTRRYESTEEYAAHLTKAQCEIREYLEFSLRAASDPTNSPEDRLANAALAQAEIAYLTQVIEPALEQAVETMRRVAGRA